MNNLLREYLADVDFPQASGIEHLDMLARRDRLEEMVLTLSSAERQALREADARLREQAPAFLAALQRFSDLPEHRASLGQGQGQGQGIPARRWWWFLDVLAAAQAA